MPPCEDDPTFVAAYFGMSQKAQSWVWYWSDKECSGDSVRFYNRYSPLFLEDILQRISVEMY